MEDIEWCVNTSNWEKKGRASARELFKKICVGDKALTKDEYNKRVADLSTNKLERKLLEKGKQNDQTTYFRKKHYGFEIKKLFF